MRCLRVSGRCAAALGVALLTIVGAAPLASAQPPTGVGTASVDGLRSQGEWDAAAVRTVFPSLPGSTLYVMNDDQNLYLGIEVVGDADLGSGDSVHVRFDNDRDLVFTNNDDGASQAPSGYLDLHYATGFGFGVTDALQHGQGAVARSAGANFFEISKPLLSGDVQDFHLAGGDPLGICLIASVNGSSSDDYPSGCSIAPDQQGYDLVEIAAVPLRPLRAFGTASVDGVKGAGEWEGAATRSIFLGASTLYVMNDDQNLYLGIEVLGDADLGSSDSMQVRFDNDRDLVLTVNDDEARVTTTGYVDDHYVSGSGFGNLDPVQDGQGAVARAAGANFFEISKPLDSGDMLDFARAPGDPLGFCLIYFLNGTSTSPDNVYPPSCQLTATEQGLYSLIEIAAVPVPALSLRGVSAAVLLLLVVGALAARRASAGRPPGGSGRESNPPGTRCRAPHRI